MPSKSPAQHRLMEAAAHTAGGFGGVPQSVGREFASADKAKAGKYGGVIGDKPKGSAKSADEHMARVASKQTQQETGRDFGKSQSTVSRKVMRAGFVSGGSAR